MIKKLLFFICYFFAYFANAQTALPQLDLHSSLAIPINETAIEDSSTSSSLVAFGFGGGFTVPVLENSPLRLGISFRYMWLGSKSREFFLTDEEGYTYELESSVKGSMSPLHIIARVDAMNYSDFPVLPYLGGFVGIRFFGTNHKLTIDYQDGSEPIIDNNRKVSVTSSYGFELGLHIRISKEILLDFRYEHAYGGWAKYVDLTSVKIDNNGNATYDRLETRTDVAMFTLGIAIMLKS